MAEITYQQAINYFGSPLKMAEKLEVSHQAVYQWGGKIPKLRRYEIKELMESEPAIVDNKKPNSQAA